MTKLLRAFAWGRDEAVADFCLLQATSRKRIHFRCPRCQTDRDGGYRKVFTFPSWMVARCCYCDENIGPGDLVALTTWDPSRLMCRGYHTPRRMRRKP